MTKTVQLTEATFHEPAKVDRESMVIRGVKVLGRESKNRRTYSEQAMQEAARLTEGIKVHVNHPDRDKPQKERGIGDFFGELRNVKVQHDGNYADLHYLKNHPLAESVLERAERFPASFGLSQNADGKVQIKGGKQFVESVVHMRSVDLVDSPATTQGLYESEDIPMKKKLLDYAKAIDAKAPGQAQLVKLLEMEPELGAEMVDAPAEGMDSEAQIKAAFRAMVVAAFDDEKLDTAATLARIKEILKSQEKLMNGGEEKKDPPPAEGEETMESVKAELARVKSENACRALLEDAGVKAEPVKLKALAGLSEAERKSLIESWKVEPKRQKPTSSAPLLESEGNEEFKTGKGFISSIMR